MLLTDAAAFRAAPDPAGTHSAACASGAFLVAPEGFSLAAQSALDNRYMASGTVAPERALAQHRGLQRALADEVPTVCFPGDPATPDAVFPNNVFATAPGRVIVGHMRHPVRQREAERADIRDFFTRVLGRTLIDLRTQAGICELTGSLVIDRARGIGYCGLSERCDPVGAAAMHAAFGLGVSFVFALAAGEYHTNVVMSVLASRALVICPEGFADPAAADAIAARYAPHVITLDRAEQQAFAGNCIALGPQTVWMSEAAADRLRPSTRWRFEDCGFRIRSVALDEIEKAGGSLRCCVGEIF
ncbi:hypothetical protein HNQ52_003263 [Chiayiivirga flava]|uniref:Amidinotransferase n=1 Tax=Chiayiivirga flava TaxID=659595 RepID=A0A7W8G101_9GAMM|nr:hypothetical protein [Chiayiivirga flava]